MDYNYRIGYRLDGTWNTRSGVVSSDLAELNAQTIFDLVKSDLPESLRELDISIMTFSPKLVLNSVVKC